MKDFILSVYATMQNRDEFFENLVKYETKMMRLFKELELKANHQHLLRAFVIACKGEAEFEASFTELDSLMHKNGKGSRKAANALKSLRKWQEEHGIELLRVVQPGQRKRVADGTFEYLKTKYRFVFLEEIINIFFHDSLNFEAALDELIEKLKAEYKGSVPKKKYSPKHNLKKAKNTIETKFRKAFELSMEAGLNPVNECRKIMDNIHNIFVELEAQTIGSDNRANFIMNFESKLVFNETLEEETIRG